MHEDGSIETYNIITEMNYRLPPGILDVALELRTQRAVIPCAVKAAVYFGRLKNKTPA